MKIALNNSIRVEHSVWSEGTKSMTKNISIERKEYPIWLWGGEVNEHNMQTDEIQAEL